MAKTHTDTLRVFINGERIGGETIRADVGSRSLVVDEDDLGWLVESMDVQQTADAIEVHVSMPAYAAALPISTHRYCEHLHTAPAGFEAKAGGIIMDRLQCQDCGRILTRPHVEV